MCTVSTPEKQGVQLPFKSDDATAGPSSIAGLSGRAGIPGNRPAAVGEAGKESGHFRSVQVT
jgi:hypothetical protein